MNKNLFSSKKNYIITWILALMVMALSFFGENSTTGFIAVMFSAQADDENGISELCRRVMFGLYAIRCLVTFTISMAAISGTLNLLAVSDFVGSCLVSAGSVLMLVGAIYSFEHITLFKAGALATGVGMLLPFIITTLIVAQNGAFNGIGFTDVLSVIFVPLEAIFFASLCFLTKSKNSVNCLETEQEDGI